MIPNTFKELDFDLGNDINVLKDSIQEFCKREIAPLAEDIDKKNDFPSHLWKKMGELGLLGITAEEKYGGSGLGYTEHVIAMQEISKASASVGLSYGAHSNLCVNQITLNGTDKQKQKYLPKLASGEHIGAFGLTEPDFGSDAGGMLTTAKKVNDGYLLNGSKMWITNSPIADIFIVWAKLDNKIKGFVLERGMKGLTTPKIEGKFSLRTSVTGEIVMDNVFVPDAGLLPKVSGLKGADYEPDPETRSSQPVVSLILLLFHKSL